MDVTLSISKAPHVISQSEKEVTFRMNYCFAGSNVQNVKMHNYSVGSNVQNVKLHNYSFRWK
jgi:hypothetical protein